MDTATIRAARKILLLAMGEGKATALLDHPDFTVFADRRLRPSATPA
jgi:hypothetical protein